MKTLQRLARRRLWIVLFAVAVACLLSPSNACAQSIGPTVDECTTSWVDPNGYVAQIVCLLGNSSSIYASSEVDSYNWNYVPQVDSSTVMSDSDSTFVAYSNYAVRDLSEQAGTDAYTAVSTTPSLNDVYTMYGNFGYCYDSSGQGGEGGDWNETGNVNCNWNYPSNYMTLQGVVTLPGGKGLLYPKYLVAGVVYAPPGHGEMSPYGASNVGYVGTTSIGTTATNSSSYSTTLGYSIQLDSTNYKIPKAITAVSGQVQITTSNSSEFTQEQDTSTSITTNKSNSIQDGTAGYPTIYAPDGTLPPEMPNDYDVILLWLNPELVYTAYPAAGNSAGFILWQGHAYDPNDLDGPDIVEVQVGCLNGHFTAAHCSSQQTNLNRSWVSDQMSPTSGTHVTAPGCSPQTAESPSICPNTQDAYEILSADPLAYNPGGSAYTLLNSIPLPDTTADGRFTILPFEPNPARYTQDGHYQYTITQMNTKQQTQGGSTDIKSKTQVSVHADLTFLSIFGVNFTYTQSDTVDQKNTWLTTLSEQQTVQNAIQLNGSNTQNYVPEEFILYQDNLYGTFLAYPKNY
jgi:hypothetical protein